jgi:hypothetical protein
MFQTKASYCIAVGLLTVSWVIGIGGCASKPIAPLPPLPETPKYVGVPHPAGLSFSDLRAIFLEPGAPTLEELKKCESDYLALRKKTESSEELRKGAREFVQLDPEKYHWCFYSKLIQLEEELKSDKYLEERQKSVLDIYLFLTPIARAFLTEYQDSRYWRWAIARYRQLSELLFYRKVEPTQEVNADLAVSSKNPMGWIPRSNREPGSVLEKYGIVKSEPGATSEAPPAYTDAEGEQTGAEPPLAVE